MEVANIYDNGPISPIAKVGENLAIWLDQAYYPYRIQWTEPMPASSPLVVDLVATSSALTVAAANQTQKTAVVALNMTENELFHARWEPLDDVEGLLWENNNMARNSTKGAQARTSPTTRYYDPWLATTTFWILGINRDPSFAAYNPWAIAQPTARFAFWGFRYILLPLKGDEAKMALKGPITYLPGQGR